VIVWMSLTIHNLYYAVHRDEACASCLKLSSSLHPSLGRGCLNKVADDGKIRVIAKGDNLLMDHQSKDTHHGSTAVVELDGTLGELGLLIKVIPAEVNVSITEVTNVLISSSGNITPGKGRGPNGLEGWVSNSKNVLRAKSGVWSHNTHMKAHSNHPMKAMI